MKQNTQVISTCRATAHLPTYHLVDTKDGTDVYTCVNVGTTIQRVKDDTVVALESLIFTTVTALTDEYCFFLLS